MNEDIFPIEHLVIFQPAMLVIGSVYFPVNHRLLARELLFKKPHLLRRPPFSLFGSQQKINETNPTSIISI